MLSYSKKYFSLFLYFKEEKTKRFLEALSVCHSIQLDFTHTEKFNGSSPDEICFVKFCSK